jgi:hypothetical protein
VKFRSQFLLLSVLLSVFAIIGCGGGGGGNPVSVPSVAGPRANLSGLVSLNGQPLPNANVYLYKADKAHLAGISQLNSIKSSMLAQTLQVDGSYSTVTDSIGRYSFTDIPVGEYTLIAVKDAQHQFAMPNVLLGNITEVNAQLTPTAAVNGRILNNSSIPVAGAFVYLEGTSYVALTDSLGQFNISHVPASQSFDLQVMSAQGVLSPAVAIALNPAETRALGDLTLAPLTTPPGVLSTTISGSVVLSGFNPPKTDASGIIVALTGQDNQQPSIAMTDASGAYSFMVTASGAYNVSVVPNQFEVSPVYQSVTTDLLSPVTVPDFTIAPVVANNYLVHGQINKTTKIYDDTDQGGVYITLQQQDAAVNEPFTRISLPDGTFAFRLPAGTYTVDINGAYELEAPFGPVSIATETNIGIINVRPNLQEDAMVTGEIIGTSGVAYEVILAGDTGVEHRRVTPTATSTFYFYDIMPGTYTMTLAPYLSGYAEVSPVSFYVAPGSITRQNINSVFVAPTITNITQPEPSYIEVTGTNFVVPVSAGDPHTYAKANGIDLTPTFSQGTWTSTQIFYEIKDLQPGNYKLELNNPDGTKAPGVAFAKGLELPMVTNIAPQDTKVKFSWENAPFTDRSYVAVYDLSNNLIDDESNFPGNSFEFESLTANATYTIRIINQFGPISSQELVATFTTKTAGIDNLSLPIALQNSGSIIGNEIFGFEVIGNRYYVGWYSGDIGQVGVHGYEMDGTEFNSVIITSYYGVPIENFSMTSGDNQIYVFHTNNSGDAGQITSYDLNLTSVQATRLFSTSPLPTLQRVKLEYYDSKLFYVGGQVGNNTYLGYLDSSLTTVENVATFSNTFAAAPGYSLSPLVDITADEKNGKLFMAINEEDPAGSGNYNKITIYEYDLADLTIAPAIAVTVDIPSISVVNLEVADNAFYLGFGAGASMIGYMHIDKNSGYRYEFTEPGTNLYSDLSIDAQNRIWVYDRTSSAAPESYFVQLNSNGIPQRSFKVSEAAAINGNDDAFPAEFIKKSANSVMHFLYKDFSNGLSVRRYNSSF